MRVYYNEHDPKKAEWVRELMKAGLIAPGDVDERSIEDVIPNELRKYTQLHFFSGIAVWSYALRNAGWPDTKRVITGSCPCQSFSAAGKRKGFDDERHLWPAWFQIIYALQSSKEFRGVPIIGEQVSSSDALAWFDLVSDDLESAGYTVRSLDIPACSVGAFHRRQRLYFVAEPASVGRRGRSDGNTARGSREIQIKGRGPLSSLDNAADPRRQTEGQHGSGQPLQPARSVESSESGPLALSNGGNPGTEREQRSGEHGQQPQDGRVGQLGDSESERSQNRRQGRFEVNTITGSANFWADAEWIYCRDGKYRPVKSGIFPLVNGATGRVALLRGAGDAIVSPQAEAFIKSYLEIEATTGGNDEGRN